MAGPYHGQHDGSRNEARDLLNKRLREEDQKRNVWAPPSVGTSVILFAVIAIAMVVVVAFGGYFGGY